ncbi:hypothetical protein J2S30_003733 [Herbaspirillum rubrisubalbicans]|nr:hypothetical protein [Herbaspirillum rubrisubalbicans]
MTVFCGTVWGRLRTSHLYAVFKGPYVYFGETGHVPPVRWKGHLTSDSDFVGKLRDVDPATLADDFPIFFVGIHLGVADDQPETLRKIARRAIEAELHRRFELDPSHLFPAKELLSTPPPVPVRHKFSFDRISISQAVYEIVAKEYQNWRKRMEKTQNYSASTRVSLRGTPEYSSKDMQRIVRHASFVSGTDKNSSVF